MRGFVYGLPVVPVAGAPGYSPSWAELMDSHRERDASILADGAGIARRDERAVAAPFRSRGSAHRVPCVTVLISWVTGAHAAAEDQESCGIQPVRRPSFTTLIVHTGLFRRELLWARSVTMPASTFDRTVLIDDRVVDRRRGSGWSRPRQACAGHQAAQQDRGPNCRNPRMVLQSAEWRPETPRMPALRAAERS